MTRSNKGGTKNSYSIPPLTNMLPAALYFYEVDDLFYGCRFIHKNNERTNFIQSLLLTCGPLTRDQLDYQIRVKWYGVEGILRALPEPNEPEELFMDVFDEMVAVKGFFNLSDTKQETLEGIQIIGEQLTRLRYAQFIVNPTAIKRMINRNGLVQLPFYLDSKPLPSKEFNMHEIDLRAFDLVTKGRYKIENEKDAEREAFFIKEDDTPEMLEFLNEIELAKEGSSV
jgi:hypothetical protein